MPRTRTTAADLAKLLNDGQSPLYVLDDMRRIVFCNAACARWTHSKVEDLIDQQCVYQTPAEATGPAAVAAGLCPPPKAFSGQQQTALVSCRASDGQLVYRRGHFFPLDDGSDESSPVLVILDQADSPGPQDAAAPSSDGLHDLVRRFRQQMAGRHGTHSLIGPSPAIARVSAQVALAARTTANVLILGPVGSGKDHVAKVIHYAQKQPGPLVPLECGLLEPAMLRSTLKALRLTHARKEGAATLLLHDVDGLPEVGQAELADLTAAGELGLRVIATAARSPLVLAGERQFSRELACALSTLVIELPPLSERLEDLPLLAQALLEECNGTSLKQLGGFTSDALDRLTAHPWRGNVDELAAVVREAHERAQHGEVTSRDLPKQILQTADAAVRPARKDETIEIEEFLARVERELITRALARAKGNKSKAARLLGLTRPRLYRRLVQLGLEQPDPSSPE